MSTTDPARPLRLLRTVALIAVVAGAAGSVGLMLRVGHRNPSSVLMVLFAIWVLSPFMALGLTDVISKPWSSLTRATLYGLMLIVTLGSLLIYGNVAFGPPRSKPASVFLLVPLASWLLLVSVLAVAASVSRSLSRRGPGA